MPVSIETLIVVVWPAMTTKVFGSADPAELQPIHWQLDRLSV
jgi:hypothetical protein